MQEKYLAHHGIKGQKWGVRNGPPYPLDASSKARADKSSGNTAKGEKFANAALQGIGEELLIQLGIELAAVATVVAVQYARGKALTKKYMNEFEEKSKTRAIKSLDECPKRKDKKTTAENTKVTNPDFPSEGTVQNCVFCTTAMAMREKGYNVKAAKTTHPWPSDKVFDKAFNSKTEKIRAKDSQTMLKKLAEQGDGAYGNLSVTWKMGGGHSIFYKNENGRVHIYDGQSGEEYDTSPNSKLMTNIYYNVWANRLDNCNPTEYALNMLEPC